MKLRLVAFLVLSAFAVACESDNGGANRGNGDKDTADESDVVATHDTVGGDDTSSNLDWNTNDDTGTPDTVIPTDTTPTDTTPTDTTPTDTTPTDTTIDVPTDTTPAGLSCKQFYADCLPSCPTDAQGQPEQACTQQCLGSLSPEGTTNLNDFQNCMQQSGCFSAASQEAMMQCLETNCMNEYYGCFHGDLSCGAMLQCMNGCPQTSQECLSNCVGDGTVEAQKAYYAIGDCIQQQCCPTDPTQCQGTAYQTCAQGAYGQQGAPCYDIAMACVNDTGFVAGGLRLPISVPSWIFKVK